LKGDQIVDAHHIAHLCKQQHILDDGSGQLGASAFAFRKTDTDGLSCNWLEHIDASRSEQLQRIRSLLRLRVKQSHRLAVVKCGSARQRVRDAISIELSIVQDPLPAEGSWSEDPSHVLIEPPPSDMLEQVATDLAVCASIEAAII
jgi:hypothetical protein